MTQDIHQQRLIKLRALLKSVGSDRFVWNQFFARFGESVEDPWCGTAACVCGHAALNPWFREQGIGVTYKYPSPVVSVQLKDGAVPECAGPENLGTFFGLSRADANFLFFPEENYEDVEDRLQRYGDTTPRLEDYLYALIQDKEDYEDRVTDPDDSYEIALNILDILVSEYCETP